MMQGLVMRSTGSFYDVLAEDRKKYNCRVRGKIRLEGIRETNPIAVGDQVQFEPEHDIGWITAILPRNNHMLRQSVKKTGHAHVLAANVDQVLVVATFAYPRTSLGFIDRFLVSAESFRIPQIVVFNKRDLLTAEEETLQEGLISLYSSLGVTTLSTTNKNDSPLDILALLQGKTTLIAGHSGVGKSTLLNRLIPGLDQRTGEISGFSDKGTHTTTFAEMFAVNENTYVIDTPGVKEWGLVDMTEQEISDYFPEMRELRLACKFGSKCLHLQEPKCAIREAVENGTIAMTRYDSYLSMVLGEDNRK
jgi:ribosome biogenesis GTPase